MPEPNIELKLMRTAYQVSLIEIARDVGLSVSSVSNKINGTATMFPDEEKRIRAAIERLGTKPPAGIRFHSAGEGRIVNGKVIPDEKEPAVRYGDESKPLDRDMRDALKR